MALQNRINLSTNTLNLWYLMLENQFMKIAFPICIKIRLVKCSNRTYALRTLDSTCFVTTMNPYHYKSIYVKGSYKNDTFRSLGDNTRPIRTGNQNCCGCGITICSRNSHNASTSAPVSKSQILRSWTTLGHTHPGLAFPTWR